MPTLAGRAHPETTPSRACRSDGQLACTSWPVRWRFRDRLDPRAPLSAADCAWPARQGAAAAVACGGLRAP
eukprot:4556483-Prymnesium_polylepis.3